MGDVIPFRRPEPKLGNTSMEVASGSNLGVIITCSCGHVISQSDHVCPLTGNTVTFRSGEVIQT